VWWFTSERERRLWLLVAAAVALIYGTLAVAPTVAAFLRSRALLGGAFIAGVILIGLAILLLGAGTRPRPIQVGIVLGLVAVLMLAPIRIALPEERTHLIEYGVIALIVYEALTERIRNGRTVRARFLIALSITGAFGIGDELIQWVLPNRVFDPEDIVVNLAAAAIALTGRVAVGRIRRSAS